MRIGGKFLMAVSSIATALVLAVVPTWAQSNNEEIEKQIKALEAEVQKIEPLKDQIERLRAQQLELKKDATEAAAAMPTFSYRPGRGVTITAADKSWAIQTSYRLNIHSHNFPEGRPRFLSNSGRTAGGTTVNTPGTTEFQLFPRRNRVYWSYCWSDCFWEINTSIDGESSPRAASVRDNEIMVHFENLNPYLPMFSFGLRRSAGGTHISRSSSSDAKLEHHLIVSGFGWGGDGSHAGLGLHWERVKMGPGDVSLYLNLATSKQGTHQEFVSNDTKGLMMYVNARPFSDLKDKWIRGLEFGYGYQGHTVSNGEGGEVRIRTHERQGRLEIFGLGRSDTTSLGDGYGDIHMPGFRWRIGPYMFRAVYLRADYTGRNDANRGVKGTGWNMSNQVFLWSPKGFLTGSSGTPNSLLVGFDFERGDMECGVGCDAAERAGSFRRNTYLNRELGIWYFIRPAMRVGTWFHWWKTDNTPVVTQVASGCKSDIVAANAGKRASRECDWYSWNLGFQVQW